MADIFSNELWNRYKDKLGHIESSNTYDKIGGSNDHYDGKYQFGKIAKKDIGLGHTKKEREDFRKDPVAQENALLEFTKLNYSRLMKNKDFAGMDIDQQMGTLAYAHNQGATGAKNWLKTGVSGKDGFGTYGTKYYKAFTDKNPAINFNSKPKERPADLGVNISPKMRPESIIEVPSSDNSYAVPPMSSIRPQMRTNQQSTDPIAVEQAIMAASVPQQQVFLSPPPILNYMDNKKTRGYNQGTSEVVPRLYADGTEGVIPDWLKNMGGYPKEYLDNYLATMNPEYLNEIEQMSGRDAVREVQAQVRPDYTNPDDVEENFAISMDLGRLANYPDHVIDKWYKSYYLSEPNTGMTTEKAMAKRKNLASNSYVPMPEVNSDDPVTNPSSGFGSNPNPVPGDRRGSPQGISGLSAEQLAAANAEARTDASAFNPNIIPVPALPQTVSGEPEVLEIAPKVINAPSAKMAARNKQEYDQMTSVPAIPGYNMAVPLIEDPRNLGGSEGYGSLGFAPQAQNPYDFNPNVPPVITEENINKEKSFNSMTQEEAYGILQNPESTEESILNARKFLSGNFEVASEKPKVPMTPEQAISVFQNPNANEAERFEARKALGGEVYSGRGELGMPAPPVVTESPAVVTEDPVIDNAKEIVPGSTSGTGLSLREDGQIVGPNGNIVEMPGESEAKSFGTTMSDLGNNLGPIFKALFGLETQDITRALGFYLMSRLSGASHEGSMRWAGGTVLKQAEARNIRNDAKTDAAIKAFAGVKNTYTAAAASKINKLLSEGKLLEAQTVMSDPKSKTFRGRYGIDADDAGTPMMKPGSTKPVLIFTGTDGQVFKKITVDGKEGFVRVPTEEYTNLRERAVGDNRSNLRDDLESAITNMNSTLFRQAGIDKDTKEPYEGGMFGGQDQQGVIAAIMKKSDELGALGLDNIPTDILDRFVKIAELAESQGIKEIDAVTLLDMIYVGGQGLINTEKLTTDDGEMLTSSQMGSFTDAFREMFPGTKGQPNYPAIQSTFAAAEANADTELFSTVKGVTEVAKALTEPKLTAAQIKKISSMPNVYTASVLFEAFKLQSKK